MYIDQSYSWNKNDVKRGLEALASINVFADNGEIDLVTKFFSNTVHDVPSNDGKNWSEGGTHAFPEILKDIQEIGAENVIIMTDSDFDDQTQWQYLNKLFIPGCVWWI